MSQMHNHHDIIKDQVLKNLLVKIQYLQFYNNEDDHHFFIFY